jgi:lactoylglutathione lyase
LFGRRSYRRSEERVEILPGRGLDFLDSWGNRVQVVQYDEIQFTKSGAALRKLGAEGIGKTADAEAEMRDRGLL